MGLSALHQLTYTHNNLLNVKCLFTDEETGDPVRLSNWPWSHSPWSGRAEIWTGHLRADPVKNFYDTRPIVSQLPSLLSSRHVIVIPETPHRSLPHLQSVFWLARYSLHPWYSESFQWCASDVVFSINWSECLLCPLFPGDPWPSVLDILCSSSWNFPCTAVYLFLFLEIPLAARLAFHWSSDFLIFRSSLALCLFLQFSENFDFPALF